MSKEIKDLEPGQKFTDYPQSNLKNLHSDIFVRLSNPPITMVNEKIAYSVLNLSTMRTSFVAGHLEVTVIGDLDRKAEVKDEADELTTAEFSKMLSATRNIILDLFDEMIKDFHKLPLTKLIFEIAERMPDDEGNSDD